MRADALAAPEEEEYGGESGGEKSCSSGCGAGDCILFFAPSSGFAKPAEVKLLGDVECVRMLVDTSGVLEVTRVGFWMVLGDCSCADVDTTSDGTRLVTWTVDLTVVSSVVEAEALVFELLSLVVDLSI